MKVKAVRKIMETLPSGVELFANEGNIFILTNPKDIKYLQEKGYISSLEEQKSKKKKKKKGE